MPLIPLLSLLKLMAFGTGTFFLTADSKQLPTSGGKWYLTPLFRPGHFSSTIAFFARADAKYRRP